MGEVKLIRLPLYFIPVPAPKVEEVVSPCGIFSGVTLSVSQLHFREKVVCARLRMRD